MLFELANECEETFKDAIHDFLTETNRITTGPKTEENFGRVRTITKPLNSITKKENNPGLSRDGTYEIGPSPKLLIHGDH